MTVNDRIEQLIAPTVSSLGFVVVRVELFGGHRPRLQIMVERPDGAGPTVEDCASVSRAVSAVLDVDDPVRGGYVLEVSSPGIDRPLVKLEDFERFAGLDAKVEMAYVMDGRRRFRGRLLGVAGDKIRMTVDGLPVELPHADIQRAKLIMTDALLAPKEEQKTS